MSTKQILVGGILLALIAGLGIGWGISSLSTQKTAYVNGAKVFSDFVMTKELNNMLSNTQQSRQQILDSLELQVRTLGIHQNSNPSDDQLLDSLKVAAEQLRFKSERFTEDNQRQLETYNEQIWTQLNQYMGDYREQEGYAYLFGATGSGNLMAANPELDVTEEVLAYVNLRYEGK